MQEWKADSSSWNNTTRHAVLLLIDRQKRAVRFACAMVPCWLHNTKPEGVLQQQPLDDGVKKQALFSVTKGLLAPLSCSRASGYRLMSGWRRHMLYVCYSQANARSECNICLPLSLSLRISIKYRLLLHEFWKEWSRAHLNIGFVVIGHFAPSSELGGSLAVRLVRL